MVDQAKALGLSALAITDHDTLAGAVPWVAQKAELHASSVRRSREGGHHLTLSRDAGGLRPYAGCSRTRTCASRWILSTPATPTIPPASALARPCA